MEANKMKAMIKDVPTITGKVNLKALGVSSTNFPKNLRKQKQLLLTPINFV